MKVFVINLKESEERRSFMAKQLNTHGIAFEFFAAIDGRKLSQKDKACVCDQKWARRHIGRDLMSEEIGCALSHLGVYRKIVEEKLPCALVLEDDAHLSSCVKPVLEAVEKKLDPAVGQICLFSECIKLSKDAIPLTREAVMSRVMAAIYLAHAYVVTLEGAKKLLSSLYPVVQVADDWAWISYHTGIELYACSSILAKQGGEWASTISNHGRGEDLKNRWKSRIWWKNKLYRKWWWALDRMGLGYYFWKKG